MRRTKPIHGVDDVLVANDECARIFPNRVPAVLRITTSDGCVHEARVMANRGGPERPLAADEILRKFTTNARSSILTSVKSTRPSRKRAARATAPGEQRRRK